MPDKQIIKEAIKYAKKLGDLPPNIAIPEMLANEVKSLAKRFSSIKAKVITKNQLKKAGADLLLGVGKDLTLDSGGLNIKVKSMEAMKFDKLDAVNCLATTQALIQLKQTLSQRRQTLKAPLKKLNTNSTAS